MDVFVTWCVLVNFALPIDPERMLRVLVTWCVLVHFALPINPERVLWVC